MAGASLIRAVIAGLRRAAALLVLSGMTVWGGMAIYYGDARPGTMLTVLAAAFALAGLAAIVSQFVRRRRRNAALGFAALFAAVLVWWLNIPPSNQRDWQTDVARPAHAEIKGDLVTVRDIRNFDYRSETDYTPAYYDKTFDVRKLRSVDMVAVYWMGPAIAHTFLSFGFEDGDHLAVSIETRKEKNEDYSTVKGFFKQYELYYVVADERDVIRLRTNYRKNPPEDVYVYRVHGPVENGRRVFLKYMQRISKLREKPEFYNTLADNCTTGIWMNSRVNPGHPRLSWKILASGYVPEYLYEAGRLAPGLPFAELQRQSHVNARAQVADQAMDFSRRIRVGVPGMDVAYQ
jgi:hypothetical protein